MIDDTATERIVQRLARPTAAGGLVVERAALLAEGAHCAEIEAWILRNGGKAEAVAPVEASDGGMFGDRRRSLAQAGTPHPTRYVLPAGALSESA